MASEDGEPGLAPDVPGQVGDDVLPQSEPVVPAAPSSKQPESEDKERAGHRHDMSGAASLPVASSSREWAKMKECQSDTYLSTQAAAGEDCAADGKPNGWQRERSPSRVSLISHESIIAAQRASAAAVSTFVAKVDPLRLTVMTFGSFLSFCAGVVNAISFHSMGTFTSHVTGTWTKVGLELEGGAYEDAGDHAKIVISFIVGAATCGVLIPKSTVLFGYAMYGWTLIGNALLLVCAVLLGRDSWAAPCVVAAACGLQNGMITSYSGAIIRTTHVTGLSTDVGLILGRACVALVRRALFKYRIRRGQLQDVRRGPCPCEDIKKLLLLLSLSIAFFGGVVLGALLFDHFQMEALLFPAGLAAVAGVCYTTYRICFLHRPIFDLSITLRPRECKEWLRAQLPEVPRASSRSWSIVDLPSFVTDRSPLSLLSWGKDSSQRRCPEHQSSDIFGLREPGFRSRARDCEAAAAEDLVGAAKSWQELIALIPEGDKSETDVKAHREAVEACHRLRELVATLSKFRPEVRQPMPSEP